eukprot:scaffold79741_cov50-Phaeocystis_antarctica.AAC.1
MLTTTYRQEDATSSSPLRLSTYLDTKTQLACCALQRTQKCLGAGRGAAPPSRPSASAPTSAPALGLGL